MKPPVIPTDKEIEELIRQQYAKRDDAPKCCGNCSNWIKEAQFCPINRKQSPAYMTCQHHKTEVKNLIEITKRFLLEDATENKKIEYLLSTALAFADMTMKVMADVESRVKKQREKETDPRIKSYLKKDLDLCEEVEGAYGEIAKKIHEIEQQFEWYVQPYFNKAFRKDGDFDEENHTKFHSDTGEFIVNNLEYQKACFLNEDNVRAIRDFQRSLTNDQYFPLTEKDINHYNVTM